MVDCSHAIARNLLAILAGRLRLHHGQATLAVTLSCGAAALQRAKLRGRNRIEVARDETLILD